MVNYDETNCSDDPGQEKVVVRRGTRHAERLMDSSKASTSVMMAVSANGDVLPPYVVYKAKYVYDTWSEGGVPFARYNSTPSGWFDMKTFEDWFETIALPYFKKAGKKEDEKVLIGDNLASHLSPRVVELCEEYNIKFIFLPPNPTHICQPLDVAFYRPFKRSWRKVLSEWKLSNRGVLPKSVFPSMLKKALDQLGPENLKKNAKSGFEATGIHPFNKEKVLANPSSFS